jgi:hypothetical protein
LVVIEGEAISLRGAREVFKYASGYDAAPPSHDTLDLLPETVTYRSSSQLRKAKAKDGAGKSSKLP